MSITPTGRYSNTVSLPQGYSNPSHPSITPVNNGEYTVDIDASLVQNNDPVIGAGNLVTQIQNNFTNVQVPVLNLDTTATIQVNLTIESYIRMSDGDDDSGFKTGTLVYRVNVTYNRN